MNLKTSRTCRALLTVVFLLGLRIAANAAEIYVASTSLYIIDDTESRITASIPLERWIYNIAVSPDGRYSYLGVSDGVHIVNVKDRKVEGLLTDQPGLVLSLDEKSGRIYVLTNERRELPGGDVEAMPSKVLVYDTKGNVLLNAIDLGRIIFDIAVVPERDRLYALDLLGSELAVFQLTSGALIETLSLGSYGYPDKDENQGFVWRMVKDPRGTRIYIPQGGRESGLLVLETATSSIRRIPLPHEAKWRGGVISPDGAKLYLNAVRWLSVIDLRTEQEIAWRPLDVPYQGIALDREGKKLYLVNPMYDRGGSLAILDAVSLEPLGRVLVPDASPYSVAVLP
jgi:DNA-binding beta-propeller fold protein YncE